MSKKTAVLAFSGGLDTSFCVPYLNEQGYDVHTVFVDTGGVDEEELAFINQRAEELGAKSHTVSNVDQEIWDEIIVPMLAGGEWYQYQYPLLCSDRYLIVASSLKKCDELGAAFAHGCTGMGNDQVRFDVTVRCLGDYEILAPIREIQNKGNVREYEQAYLEEKGFGVRAKTAQYTINENVLGVTVSGSEIDEFKEPGRGSYVLTAHPDEWPDKPISIKIGLEQGEPVSIDGEKMSGPDILKYLNKTLAPYGVGRGIYTGDTTIGLKGRIVYEAPGITALFTAHKALEEAVLSRQQNGFKSQIAKKWIELVYTGLFHDPLKYDLEAYLKSSQKMVTGSVTLQSFGGQINAIEIDSDNILTREGATYAQEADWGAAEAEGFIRLFGQSSELAARRS